MYTYRLTIAYDGTRYRGWQRQQNTEQTVQGTVEACLSQILGRRMQISGSGRTDSGVHASGQEASLLLEKRIDAGELLRKLNAALPEDIRIRRVREMPAGFHARKSALAKCYEYHVDLREKQDVFTRKYSFHFPKQVDVEAMRQAAEKLTGTHDFAGFTDLKEHDDTVRTIYAIQIAQEGEELVLSYYGDGFLYHMVRILTGTLLDVGTGRTRPEQIRAILAAKDRAWTGFPAPAKGLFLRQVYYDREELPAEIRQKGREE